MPRTKSKVVERKNVRIPKPLIDEVDRVVREYGLYVNRQQFVESAVREKVERFKLLRENVGDAFSVHVKETFLAHSIVSIVKEETLPAHHLEKEKLEERIRRFILKHAEREGRRITEKRLNELTKEILEYHERILEGLSLIEKVEKRL